MKAKKIDYKPEMTYESILNLLIKELPECDSTRNNEGTKKEFIESQRSNYIACWIYTSHNNRYLRVGPAISGSAQFAMRVWPFFFTSSLKAQRNLIRQVIDVIERKYSVKFYEN